MLGKSFRIAALWAVSTLPASADGLVDQIVDLHILPGYRALAEESSRLAATAAERCEPQDRALRDSYAAAFDAWVRMSHLRFGPSEENDRAFALAFWPDTRGKTQKALRKLILSSDPVVDSEEEFGTVSIAARGFYALEFMLYDQEFAELGQPAYRCALIRAMATDIARLTEAIIAEWQPNYADLMRNAGSNDTYRTEAEALRRVFTSLAAGLQFASEARLGRPLGTFDRPRPRRAEARRSGRSLAHIDLSLKGTRELAALLSENDAGLDAAFIRALEIAERLDDPVFAGVADPQTRLKVEVLQQSIDLIREILVQEIGPRLGIVSGFNLQDGD